MGFVYSLRNWSKQEKKDGELMKKYSTEYSP